jgi:hypothetical protein
MDDTTQGAQVRETADLALAAFMHMNQIVTGMRLMKAIPYRKSRSTEYLITFDDPRGKWEEMCCAYANSEAQRFDSSVRTLKKLLRSTEDNGGGG